VGVMAPVEFGATRFYKSGDVTTTTGKRAARRVVDKQLKGRTLAARAEIGESE